MDTEKLVGITQASIARAMGVSAVVVHQWVRGKRRIPAARAIQFALATGWAVTPHELRPDIYPDRYDGLPVDVTMS